MPPHRVPYGTFRSRRSETIVGTLLGQVNVAQAPRTPIADRTTGFIGDQVS